MKLSFLDNITDTDKFNNFIGILKELNKDTGLTERECLRVTDTRHKNLFYSVPYFRDGSLSSHFLVEEDNNMGYLHRYNPYTKELKKVTTKRFKRYNILSDSLVLTLDDNNKQSIYLDDKQLIDNVSNIDIIELGQYKFIQVDRKTTVSLLVFDEENNDIIPIKSKEDFIYFFDTVIANKAYQGYFNISVQEYFAIKQEIINTIFSFNTFKEIVND